MNKKTYLSDWLTKNEIMEQEGISLTLYKTRLKELKTSPQYSSYTKTIKVENNTLKRGKTTKRIIHSSVVKQFFGRRRVVFNQKQRLEWWIRSVEWDFFCSVMPESIKEGELLAKSRYLLCLLRTNFGKRTRMFLAIEDNPNGNGLHAHFLIKNSRISQNELKDLVSVCLTPNYNHRVHIKTYNSTSQSAENHYLLKDPQQRFYRDFESLKT
jgi:hypothetical protein